MINNMNTTASMAGTEALGDFSNWMPILIMICIASLALAFSINYDWTNKTLKRIIKKLKGLFIILETWGLGTMIKVFYYGLKQFFKYLGPEYVDYSWLTLSWVKEWILLPVLIGVPALFIVWRVWKQLPEHVKEEITKNEEEESE